MPEVVVHIGASHTQTAFLHAALARSSSLAPTGSVQSVPHLAGAGPEEVEQFLRGCPIPPSRVVLVVRDLQRHLPILWTQHALDAGGSTFQEYVTELEHDRQHDTTRWRAIDAARALQPWSRQLGPECIHVVTVPAAPGNLSQLWQRFATACGVDAERLDVAAVEARSPKPMPAAAPPHVVGDWTPIDVALWSDPRVARWSDDVRDRLATTDYVVHGDLDELAPRTADASDDVQLDAAVDLLRALVQVAVASSPSGPSSAPGSRPARAKDLARSLRNRLRGNR